MQLTRASRHVVQALVHLARERPGVWVTAQEIGQAEDIPDKFLGKLLGQLVKARMVRSVKRPNGGYSLGRPPKDITLLEIIEAVDGPAVVTGYEGEKGYGVWLLPADAPFIVGGASW